MYQGFTYSTGPGKGNLVCSRKRRDVEPSDENEDAKRRAVWIFAPTYMWPESQAKVLPSPPSPSLPLMSPIQQSTQPPANTGAPQSRMQASVRPCPPLSASASDQFQSTGASLPNASASQPAPLANPDTCLQLPASACARPPAQAIAGADPSNAFVLSVSELIKNILAPTAGPSRPVSPSGTSACPPNMNAFAPNADATPSLPLTTNVTSAVALWPPLPPTTGSSVGTPRLVLPLSTDAHPPNTSAIAPNVDASRSLPLVTNTSSAVALWPPLPPITGPSTGTPQPVPPSSTDAHPPKTSAIAPNVDATRSLPPITNTSNAVAFRPPSPPTAGPSAGAPQLVPPSSTGAHPPKTSAIAPNVDATQSLPPTTNTSNAVAFRPPPPPPAGPSAGARRPVPPSNTGAHPPNTSAFAPNVDATLSLPATINTQRAVALRPPPPPTAGPSGYLPRALSTASRGYYPNTLALRPVPSTPGIAPFKYSASSPAKFRPQPRQQLPFVFDPSRPPPPLPRYLTGARYRPASYLRAGPSKERNPNHLNCSRCLGHDIRFEQCQQELQQLDYQMENNRYIMHSAVNRSTGQVLMLKSLVSEEAYRELEGYITVGQDSRKDVAKKRIEICSMARCCHSGSWVIRPVLKDWLEKRHGFLTFCATQEEMPTPENQRERFMGIRHLLDNLRTAMLDSEDVGEFILMLINSVLALARVLYEQ